MHALRLLAVHLRLGILNELQYRTNLFVQLVGSLVGLLTALLGLGVVFSKTDNLAGWSPDELLAIVGVYFLVGGMAQMVIQPSLSRFMEEIRLGTLDFTLTKPADAQLLASIKKIEVWKLIDVAIGVGLIVYALVRLGASVGVSQAATFGLLLLAGMAIVYSFLVILATCAFWFVKLENIFNIFQSMYEAGRWPIGIYPGWLRAALTFVVPIGFAVTIPASGLVGRLSPANLVLAVVLAVAMPLVARAFWRVGIRHYSGASA